MEPFSIQCETCGTRLKVRDASLIGQLQICPKCQSIVHIVAPVGTEDAIAEAPSTTDSSPSEITEPRATKAVVPPPPPQPSKEEVAAAAAVVAAVPELPDVEVGSGDPIAPPPLPSDASAAALAAATTAAPVQYISPQSDPTPPARWKIMGGSAAAGIVIAVSLWMLGSLLFGGATPEPAVETSPAEEEITTPEVPPATEPEEIDEEEASEDYESYVSPGEEVTPDALPDEEVATDELVTSEAEDTGADEVVEETPPTEEATDEVAVVGSEPADDVIEEVFGLEELAIDEESPAAEASAIAIEPVSIPPSPELLNRLETSVSAIEFENVRLDHFLELLSQLALIEFRLDPAALVALDLTPQSTLSVTSEEASVRRVLNEALASLGLSPHPHGNIVIVSLPKADDTEVPLRKVRYRVADLASNELELVALADLAQQLVAPLSWRVGAGRGTIEIDSKERALIVTQNRAVKYALLKFFEKLRVARQLPLKSSFDPARFELASARDRAASTLAKPVTVRMDSTTTLASSTRQLHHTTGGVRFAIDPWVWQDEQPLEKLAVAGEAEALPLEEFLEAWLTPAGLAYRVLDDGSILLTTPARVEQQMKIAFYVAVSPPHDDAAAEALLIEIQRAVGAASWDAAGGRGQLHVDLPSGALIVHQSPALHLRLANWLRQRPGR